MKVKNLVEKEAYLFTEGNKVVFVVFHGVITDTELENNNIFLQDFDKNYYTILHLSKTEVETLILPVTKLWKLLYEA